jgi:HAE1 family hydrophobic/amphiphilic exporter-1
VSRSSLLARGSCSIRAARRRIGIPGWALKNPYAVFSAYLGLVLAAIAAALFFLPTRMMPYVPSPLISVITMTPGYSAREVETYFSKPMEERMTDLKGVRFIRSISQQGLSTVTLQFPYGTDMQRALVDVQQLVKQAEGDLPYDRANLKPSYVVPVDPLNTPVLQLAVTGTGWDPVRLREFVANDVVGQLKSVDGVQVVVPFGGLQRCWPSAGSSTIRSWSSTRSIGSSTPGRPRRGPPSRERSRSSCPSPPRPA